VGETRTRNCAPCPCARCRNLAASIPRPLAVVPTPPRQDRVAAVEAAAEEVLLAAEAREEAIMVVDRGQARQLQVSRTPLQEVGSLIQPPAEALEAVLLRLLMSKL